MKINDTIPCVDTADAIRTLQHLDSVGFQGLVGMDVSGNLIVIITKVPETEYLVQAADQNGRRQNAYCSTLEEAEEIAAEYGSQYEFVEILEGYPGEWKERR